MGTEFHSGKMEKVLEMVGNADNISNATLHINMVEMVNFMLSVF